MAPRVYRVQPPANGDLKIELDGGAGTTNELYVKFGDVPTRQSFDVLSNVPNQADQSVILGSTQTGAYYILVVATSAAAGQAITVTASVPGFTVESVSPSRVGNTGQATLNIRGARFDQTSQPRLIDSAGQIHSPQDTVLVDSSQIYATFDLSGLPLGLADVRVVNAGNVAATRDDALQIIAGAPGHLDVSLTVPDRVRVGRDFSLLVQYRNTGDSDLLAPVLVLSAAQQLTQLSLSSDGKEAGSSLYLIAYNPHGPAGILPPGAEGSITVFGRATGGGRENFQLSIGTYGATIDYQALESQLRPAGLSDATWQSLYGRLQTQIGPEWNDYVRMLSENASRLPASLGQPFSLRDVFGLEIDEALAALQTSVSGRVSFADTQLPVGNVRIRLYDAAQGIVATGVSTQDGDFTIGGIAAGSYEVQLEDYLLATPVSVNVTDQDVTGLAVTVRPAGSVAGRIVLASEGAPLANVDVYLSSGNGVFLATKTNAVGGYSFNSLLAGTYTLTAGGGAYSTSVENGISLSAAQLARRIDLAVSQGATLTGLVQRADGTAIAGATVTALAKEEQGGSASTDANGRYTLPGLAQGSYQVRAEAPGFVEAILQNVAVGGDAGAVDRNLTMSVGGTVKGRVTNPLTGAGMPLVFLVLSRDGQPVAAAQADVDGYFESPPVPAATYDFTLQGAGAVKQTGTVSVTAGQETRLDRTLVMSGTITGQVRNAAGQSLASLQVFAYVNDSPIASSGTDAEGKYALRELPVGNISVRRHQRSGLDRIGATSRVPDRRCHDGDPRLHFCRGQHHPRYRLGQRRGNAAAAGPGVPADGRTTAGPNGQRCQRALSVHSTPRRNLLRHSRRPVCRQLGPYHHWSSRTR